MNTFHIFEAVLLFTDDLLIDFVFLYVNVSGDTGRVCGHNTDCPEKTEDYNYYTFYILV